MALEIPVEEIWPTPSLIRAARGLVGIDQATLAEDANVSRKAIVSIENDTAKQMDYRRVEVILKLGAALEKKRGVEFIRPTTGRGAGVRFLKADRR